MNFDNKGNFLLFYFKGDYGRNYRIVSKLCSIKSQTKTYNRLNIILKKKLGTQEMSQQKYESLRNRNFNRRIMTKD